MTPTPIPTTRITVLGAGFAGLSTVRALRRQDPHAEITLVAPRAELHYLPGIIWIPAGLRRREDLVVPLENFFRRQRVRHVAAEVTGLADGGRTVLTTAGPLANDGLVIATGGRFLKKLPGIEHAITPCEGIAAAERIRDRLRAMLGGTIAVGFAGNPRSPARCAAGRCSSSCSASTSSCGARAGGTASSWSSSTPRPNPAPAWARRPCSACWARWPGAASARCWATRWSASRLTRW
jgi:hypothetical protein